MCLGRIYNRVSLQLPKDEDFHSGVSKAKKLIVISDMEDFEFSGTTGSDQGPIL
jgi:hypothetical protein